MEWLYEDIKVADRNYFYFSSEVRPGQIRFGVDRKPGGWRILGVFNPKGVYRSRVADNQMNDIPPSHWRDSITFTEANKTSPDVRDNTQEVAALLGTPHSTGRGLIDAIQKDWTDGAGSSDPRKDTL